MAEEKQKKTRSAVPDPEPEESVQNTEEVKSEAENTVSTDESGGEEIVLSGETLAEIGDPDKELVFKRIAKAYEEAKRVGGFSRRALRSITGLSANARSCSARFRTSKASVSSSIALSTQMPARCVT